MAVKREAVNSSAEALERALLWDFNHVTLQIGNDFTAAYQARRLSDGYLEDAAKLELAGL